MNNNIYRFFIILILVIATVLTLAACGNSTKITTSEPTAQSDQTQNVSNIKSFTKEELKKYNGQNGNPAYVAVDGKVYDVTNISYWKGGKHNGFEAGNDLTKEIKTVSPHGVANLVGVPVVGKLLE